MKNKYSLIFLVSAIMMIGPSLVLAGDSSAEPLIIDGKTYVPVPSFDGLYSYDGDYYYRASPNRMEKTNLIIDTSEEGGSDEEKGGDLLDKDSPDAGKNAGGKDDKPEGPGWSETTKLTNWYNFLGELNNALSGYTWMSYLFHDQAEDNNLLAADNEFVKALGSVSETFIDEMCRMDFFDVLDNNYDGDLIIGGPPGGLATAWMAGERSAYTFYNQSTGEEVIGYLYKISGEVNMGRCEELSVYFVLSGPGGTASLMVDNETGEDYLYEFSEDQGSVMFTGSQMIIKFSEKDYASVGIAFDKVTPGCIGDIAQGHTEYWSIVERDLDNAATVISGNPLDDSGDWGGNSGSPTSGSW